MPSVPTRIYGRTRALSKTHDKLPESHIGTTSSMTDTDDVESPQSYRCWLDCHAYGVFRYVMVGDASQGRGEGLGPKNIRPDSLGTSPKAKQQWSGQLPVSMGQPPRSFTRHRPTDPILSNHLFMVAE